MIILGFLAGAAFGAMQYLLARRVLIGKVKKALAAFYIALISVLSFGMLALVFFLWRDALLAAAVGIVASSIVLAVIFNLKR